MTQFASWASAKQELFRGGFKPTAQGDWRARVGTEHESWAEVRVNDDATVEITPTRIGTIRLIGVITPCKFEEEWARLLDEERARVKMS